MFSLYFQEGNFCKLHYKFLLHVMYIHPGCICWHINVFTCTVHLLVKFYTTRIQCTSLHYNYTPHDSMNYLGATVVCDNGIKHHCWHCLGVTHYKLFIFMWIDCGFQGLVYGLIMCPLFRTSCRRGDKVCVQFTFCCLPHWPLIVTHSLIGWKFLGYLKSRGMKIDELVVWVIALQLGWKVHCLGFGLQSSFSQHMVKVPGVILTHVLWQIMDTNV